MKKNVKGTKVDTSAFFQSVSTGIAAVNLNENTDRYQRNDRGDRNDRPFENRRAEREPQPSDGEVSWRGVGTGGAPRREPERSFLPTDNTGDKFQSSFSRGRPQSQSTSGWGKPEDRLAPSGDDKWSTAFPKSGPSTLRSNVSDSSQSTSESPQPQINTERREQPKLSTTTIAPPRPPFVAVVQPEKPKEPKVLSKSKVLKLEASKKLQEAKSSLAAKVLQEAKEQEELENASIQIANELYDTLLKGKELVDHMKKNSIKLSASIFVTKIFNSLSDPLSCKWLTLAEYGNALKYLLSNNTQQQTRFLFTIQKKYNELKFPKILIKEVSRNLIEIVFQLLYQNEIIENEAFIKWSDDDNSDHGKTNAVFQTTPFFQFLTQADEDDGEEEDDEDEIDAPMVTIP